MTEKIEKIQTGIQNSGVADATAVAVEQDSGWIKSKRYMYFASMILPGVPILSAFLANETGNGLWLWSLFVVFYAILPVLDQWSGVDAANPSDELVEELKDDRYYVYTLWRYGNALDCSSFYGLYCINIGYFMVQYFRCRLKYWVGEWFSTCCWT
jgi:hypothetical protein